MKIKLLEPVSVHGSLQPIGAEIELSEELLKQFQEAKIKFCLVSTIEAKVTKAIPSLKRKEKGENERTKNISSAGESIYTQEV